jgi:hypothetical protein
LGLYLQNATLTPDFPRTAELVSARWEVEVGGPVDGVVSLDAVAVSTVLSAVGPVVDPDGTTLSGDTFVSAILRDPYLGQVDPEALDQLFAAVAASMFQELLAADLDGADLFATLRTLVTEQRVRIWSAHPDEEAVLLRTSTGGAFLTGPFDGSSGVFLTDTTGGKLDYYLTATTTLDQPVCHAGTDGTANLTLTLTYDPPDGVESASVYLRGPDSPTRRPGDNTLLVSLYPASGGVLGPVQDQDGHGVGGQQAKRGGRTGLVVPVTLAPGQTVTLITHVPVRDQEVSVWTTPTTTSGGIITRTCD